MTQYGGAEPRRPQIDSPYDGSSALFRGGKTAYGLDDVFDILSDRRRRIVLNHLRDAEVEWISVGDLAEQIAAWEVELIDPASVSVESIEIDLVHGHLPKLEART